MLPCRGNVDRRPFAPCINPDGRNLTSTIDVGAMVGDDGTALYPEWRFKNSSVLELNSPTSS